MDTFGTPADRFRVLPWIAIAALFWLVLFPITSVDAYYHLAVGKWMLDQRAIPDRAVFSATFGDRPWHDNEWGFQLLVAAIAPTKTSTDGVREITPVGRVALIVLRAACLAATLALLSAAMARSGVDPISRAVGVVLAGFLTFNNLFWTIRPQILTYLGLAVTIWLLERNRGGSSRAPWWTLPVIALWANVHGAFIVAVVLLGSETIGAWLDRDLRWRSLAVVTALAPFAACVNPLGWRQVVHPFLYVLHPEIHAGNAEWTRPDWLHLPLMLATLLAYGVSVVADGRPKWANVLRVLAFVGMLTTAIRHLPLAALVVVPALFATATSAAERGGWRANLLPTGPRWAAVRWRLVAATMLVAATVALSGARFVGLRPQFTERPVRPMPEQAVRVIAGAAPVTVFNSYRMGGFLMFRLYPREVVFMDGRNDVYGAFRDGVYNRILRAEEPGWREAWDEVSEEHDVGWVLLDDDAPIARKLEHDPGWYRWPTSDEATVLLARRSDRTAVVRGARSATETGDHP